MGVSVDGFVADRHGDFAWTAPTDEVFACHLEEVGGLGAYLLGRRLYEAMRVWETEPAMRTDELRSRFADVWCALPKVVFSQTLARVEGNARLAEGTVEQEVAAALAATDRPVSIGGAALAGQAVEAGLVDELRIFRHPVVVGGGTPYLPPVRRDVALEVVDVRPFSSGVVLERYRRV